MKTIDPKWNYMFGGWRDGNPSEYMTRWEYKLRQQNALVINLRVLKRFVHIFKILEEFDVNRIVREKLYGWLPDQTQYCLTQIQEESDCEIYAALSQEAKET